MVEKLGVTKIGENQITALLAGDFPTVTEAVVVSGAADLMAGSVVMRNADGTVSLVSGNPATVKVFGVAAEDIPSGGTGAIWRTGQFVRDRLFFGSGTWQDWVPALPDTIFFHGARLAPNQ